MKIWHLVPLILVFASSLHQNCTESQLLQLHQFRDFLLYIYQNTGFLIDHYDSCVLKDATDLYYSSTSMDPDPSSLFIGHRLIDGEFSYDLGPNSLVVTIRDKRFIDNEKGEGFGGYFSDIDIDNLLRNLLTAEGRKRNIFMLNYIIGENEQTILHLVSFLFEGDKRKRYFIIHITKQDISFVVSESFDFIKDKEQLSFVKAKFGMKTLKTKRSGTSISFDRCLASMRAYPDQPVENLKSCSALLYDLSKGLWKIQAADLETDCNFIRMFDFFVTEFEKERDRFSLDLFNLLILRRFRWMEPITFDALSISRQLSLIAEPLFNPSSYNNKMTLSDHDRCLLTRMHDRIITNSRWRKKMLKK